MDIWRLKWRNSERQEEYEYVVTVKLKPDYSTIDKRTNAVKIIRKIVKDDIDPDKILDNGFAASDLVFKNVKEVNKCLRIKDRKERAIIYVITGKTTQSKGVITAWDSNLQELLDTIDNKDLVLNVERLRKRIWNEESGSYHWTATKHIVLTMKGNKVSEEISIFNGLTTLSVRPFVDVVIQCFQCYGFGHWKDTCKKKRKCLICGQKYHGRCEMKEKCINCGEEHKASDKTCKIYKINEQMNKIKAEEIVTSYEAKIKIQKAQKKEDNKEDEKKRREKENTAIIRREREVTERSIRRGTEDEQERGKME